MKNLFILIILFFIPSLSFARTVSLSDTYLVKDGVIAEQTNQQKELMNKYVDSIDISYPQIIKELNSTDLISNNNQCNFNYILTIISIFITIIALIVSIVAFRTAKVSLLLTSRELHPRINCKIEEDKLIVINLDYQIYNLFQIEVYHIYSIGFEDYERDGYVLFSYIAKSSEFGGIVKSLPKYKTIHLDFIHGEDTYLEYRPQPIIKDACKYIRETYCVGNERGYVSPMFNNKRVLIKYSYINQHNEIHYLYQKYEQLHGGFTYYESILEKEFIKLLKDANHINFKCTEDAISYLTTHYFNPHCTIK